MRSAVSRLIEVTAKVRVRLSVKSQKTLHDSLDENLKHPNGDIQVSFFLAHSPLECLDCDEPKDEGYVGSVEIWEFIEMICRTCCFSDSKYFHEQCP